MAADSPRAKLAAAALVTLAFIPMIAGCGGSASVDKAEVTLTVRSEGSPERRLLGQIYAQALKGAGYRVRKAPPSLETKVGLEGLKAKQISGYPEYISTSLLYDFGVEIEDIPARTQAAYGELEKNLEGRDLAAFPPAPYSIENAVGMARKAAEERGLQTNSDLKGKAEEMTIMAPTYCHVSVECLGGIERHYHTAFEGVAYERALTPELTWWRAEPDFRYETLEDGVTDASILFSTDGRLAREKDRFVALEDDKRIFPASNFVWVTSQDVAEEAGPDYEKAIVGAQKGLTLGVMRKLNARMELDGKSPAAVAAEYLKSLRQQ
jgi:osmoprotectant transport system substrate-binding protein